MHKGTEEPSHPMEDSLENVKKHTVLRKMGTKDPTGTEARPEAV